MVHRSNQDLQIQVICILFYSKYLFNMFGISAGIVSEIEKYVLIIITLISVQKKFYTFGKYSRANQRICICASGNNFCNFATAASVSNCPHINISMAA